MLLPDASAGHPEHDQQREVTPGQPLGHATNRMELKCPGDIKAAIDTRHGGPMRVFAFPCTAAPVHPHKHTPISGSGIRMPGATGHAAWASRVMPAYFGGHRSFRVLRSASKPNAVSGTRQKPRAWSIQLSKRSPRRACPLIQNVERRRDDATGPTKTAPNESP